MNQYNSRNYCVTVPISEPKEDIHTSLRNDGVGTPSVLSSSKRSIVVGKKPVKHWKAKRSERKFF